MFTFSKEWMISAKFVALFLKKNIFSSTEQSDKHVKHFQLLPTNFFVVSGIPHGITN